MPCRPGVALCALAARSGRWLGRLTVLRCLAGETSITPLYVTREPCRPTAAGLLSRAFIRSSRPTRPGGARQTSAQVANDLRPWAAGRCDARSRTRRSGNRQRRSVATCELRPASARLGAPERASRRGRLRPPRRSGWQRSPRISLRSPATARRCERARPPHTRGRACSRTAARPSATPGVLRRLRGL